MEKFETIQMRPVSVSECRGCLMKSPNLTPMTSSIKVSAGLSFVPIYQMLQAIYPSKVAYSANVTGICFKCLGQLKVAYRFMLQLKESEQTLRHRLGSSKSGTEIQGNELMTEEPMWQRLETSKSGTKFQDNEMTTEEPAQEPSTVELICGRNKYDLRNVVIVEDEVVDEHNYAGFLDQLGTEISAEFVKNRAERTSTEEETSPEISPLFVKVEAESTSTEEEITIFVNIPDHEYSQAEPPVVTETPVVTSPSKKKKSLQCKLCSFVTKTRSTYNYHVLKHAGPKFHCDICPGKSFYLSSKLKNHIDTFHNGFRPFLCSLCGKSFSDSSGLSYHMKVHNNERKHVCEVCGYKFYVAGNLARHMLTHTKEKPFKCRFCDKRFRGERHRKLHENMHLNIKPYKCKYCEKEFFRISNLQYHHMTHPGAFKCNICPDKSFMQAKYLTTHMAKAHKHLER